MSRTLRNIAISCAAIMLFGLAATAQAATVYVNAANNGGVEDGTPTLPFNTIQEGLNAAVAGDTVSVAPGIYYGGVALADQVKLVSEQGPAVTIIDGMGGTGINQAVAQSPRGSISGFTIRNCGTGVYAQNRVSFWSYNEMVISNCIFKDCTIGIVAYPASKVYVTQTLFTNAGGGDWGRVIDAIWCGAPEFKNVTIDRARTAIYLYQTSQLLTNTTISNVQNVVEIWGSRGTGYVYGSNNNLWNYTNLSVANWSGWLPTIALTNTLNSDPLFVNALAGDFRLQSASPLIDAGVNIGLPYSGSAPDIGAYEADVSIPEMIEGLAESYQDVPLQAYKNVGEQRRHALSNKFRALLEELAAISESMPAAERLAIYQNCLNKLTNDIWAKGDGFYGGNPNNDWIVTQEEQARLYEKVQEIAAAINEEIALL